MGLNAAKKKSYPAVSLFTAAMADDSTAATCALKNLSKDSQILGLHLGTWV